MTNEQKHRQAIKTYGHPCHYLIGHDYFGTPYVRIGYGSAVYGLYETSYTFSEYATAENFLNNIKIEFPNIRKDV